MNLYDEFDHRIANDKGYDNGQLAKDLIKIARKHLTKQYTISGVLDSLPDEDKIEDESYDYIEKYIYASSDGAEHEDCRLWAFQAGAEWMKKKIKGKLS